MQETEPKDANRSKLHGKPGRSGPPGNKNHLKHGYYSLVKLVKSRHGALDKRTILGKMVVETQRQLTADMGGDPSTAEQMLIRDVAIDTLLLQALESRLDVAPIRKGKIHPVYTLRAAAGFPAPGASKTAWLKACAQDSEPHRNSSQGHRRRYSRRKAYQSQRLRTHATQPRHWTLWAQQHRGR